jgi:acyl-CoA reductase-like NAD-dependent aldehyde dehydrogenase
MSHVQFAPDGPWRSMTPQERGKLIWRLADLVEQNTERLAMLDSIDSGKPINEMIFGGTKESGWGRETCRETLEEYLETKTVVVSL